MSTITDLQYPIGRLTRVIVGERPDAALGDRRDRRAARADARRRWRDWRDAQLDTPYRPGGWTVRQVVHHVPDSHMNAYIRLKLALTEDAPTIKPYDEKTWAMLADSRLPVEVSLTLLDSVHARWVALCRDLKAVRLGAHVHPSGVSRGSAHDRLARADLRVALAPSPRAHHFPAAAGRLACLAEASPHA